MLRRAKSFIHRKKKDKDKDLDLPESEHLRRSIKINQQTLERQVNKKISRQLSKSADNLADEISQVQKIKCDESKQSSTKTNGEVLKKDIGVQCTFDKDYRIPVDSVEKKYLEKGKVLQGAARVKENVTHGGQCYFDRNHPAYFSEKSVLKQSQSFNRLRGDKIEQDHPRNLNSIPKNANSKYHVDNPGIDTRIKPYLSHLSAYNSADKVLPDSTNRTQRNTNETFIQRNYHPLVKQKSDISQFLAYKYSRQQTNTNQNSDNANATAYDFVKKRPLMKTRKTKAETQNQHRSIDEGTFAELIKLNNDFDSISMRRNVVETSFQNNLKKTDKVKSGSPISSSQYSMDSAISLNFDRSNPVYSSNKTFYQRQQNLSDFMESKRHNSNVNTLPYFSEKNKAKDGLLNTSL